MGVSSALNFTIENNSLFGNTSFIGINGPNCTAGVPTPSAFIIDLNNTQSMTVQSDFQTVANADGLTCLLPPQGGNYWPFRVPVAPSGPGKSGGGVTKGQKAGISFGIILGALILVFVMWLIRRWAVRRSSRLRRMIQHTCLTEKGPHIYLGQTD